MKKFIKVLPIILIITLMFPAAIFAYDFQVYDMSEINQPSEWAKSEIETIREAGLLTKNTNNFFKKDITRGEFAELVVNMTQKVTGKEISPAPASTFVDTSQADILKAYSAGIVSGVSKTEFAPDNYITREQIAVMLYNAIEYLEKEKDTQYTMKNDDITKYNDKMNVAPWAKKSVGILANNNIMAGTSETTLSPKAPATIEQSALLVYRLYNVVTK